jgi:transposase-like protein
MSNDRPATLIEALRYFSDPDICQDFIVRMRWPDGVVTCPTCGRTDVSYLANQGRWQCKSKHSKRQFSVKVGTIFEDSPIGLDKWLAAMWLLASDKNGISSYELGRALGVTQATAWFMLQRIRLVMQDEDSNKLDGTVEVDETFIGGKARFMHRSRQAKAVNGRGPIGKTAVMGLLERHGPDGHSAVRASVIPNVRRSTLGGQVRRNVERGAQVISDAWVGYRGLEREYIRSVIDHAEKYVDGQVHTNGIENFWALLKRAIKGTYVSVEPFHLFRYVDEEAFRFNTRKASDGERFERLASKVTGKRLTYVELIGATTTPA